jgi:outer membrane protein, heavy metal efflux system
VLAGRVDAQAATMHAAAHDSASATSSLDTLLLEADAASPVLRVAAARARAARARIAPAGTRPDPMLVAGLVNLPVSRPSLSDDEMTMTMVGVSQTITYPGKLALRRRSADFEARAADAALDAARADVRRAVQAAYFELAYLDRALALTAANRDALVAVARASEARYSAGAGAQQDVLVARTEATRVADDASMLLEQRRATVARLNAAVGRAGDVPVSRPEVPERLARAALGDTQTVRFVASTLGARAAGSPLPTLDALQDLAERRSPMLRQHEAMIGAQGARAELARKDRRPDVDVMLEYGRREGRMDMITAQVSVPLPLHRRTRQDAGVAEAGAELSALEAEHDFQLNELRADVARMAGDAERARTQLALFATSILPQGRAAVAASLAGYRTGRGELTGVLAAESALYASETTYARALSDFATAVAALEQVTGGPVLAEVAR